MLARQTQDPRADSLLLLLDAYQPADHKERKHLNGMLTLLQTTSDPFSRAQTDPGHFTASAFVISQSERMALLIRHPVLALWLQPGGHFESDDRSAHDSAMREVLEETGLTGVAAEELFDVDVHPIPARGEVPAHLHFDVRFLVFVAGLPTISSSEKLTTRWFTYQHIQRDVEDVSVRRMAQKARDAGYL